MKSTLVLLGTLALCVGLTLPGRGAPPPGYRLAWADEFNGTQLDMTKWSHRGLGKRRDAINTRDAVEVKGGHLVITTYTEEGKHYTGMIATHGKFERHFGYWEARIAWNDVPGMWSAFWIHTPTMGRPVGDPAKAGMEIDVVEHRAVTASGKNIAGKVQHTLHWDGYGKDHKSKGHLTEDLGLERGFHTYGLEWTETEFRFYVDGKVTWTASPVSKRDEFIILSSEVHDGRWAGRIPQGGYGDREHSRVKMLVDYVRYYEPASSSVR